MSSKPSAIILAKASNNLHHGFRDLGFNSLSMLRPGALHSIPPKLCKFFEVVDCVVKTYVDTYKVDVPAIGYGGFLTSYLSAIRFVMDSDAVMREGYARVSCIIYV